MWGFCGRNVWELYFPNVVWTTPPSVVVCARYYHYTYLWSKFKMRFEVDDARTSALPCPPLSSTSSRTNPGALLPVLFMLSDFEATSYYLGVKDDHPFLLLRTGSDKYPFVQPRGSQAIGRSNRFGMFTVPFSTPSWELWVPFFAT
jgi:hypothetical protein